MSVMRSALLWASTNPWMRERATKTKFVRRSVVKFMPGETIEEAITAARSLAPLGLNTILTRLGENITRIEEAQDKGSGPGRRPVYNSIQMLGDDGAIIGTYDKVHLVPGGEFLPFQSTLEALGIRQLTRLPGRAHDPALLGKALEALVER